MSDLITLTFDQWEAQFKPLPNVLDDNASGDFGNGGCMYETYGTELEAIQKADANTVWTLTEADGEMFIQSGWHLVNRLGYFFTAKPFNPAHDYQIEY